MKYLITNIRVNTMALEINYYYCEQSMRDRIKSEVVKNTTIKLRDALYSRIRLELHNNMAMKIFFPSWTT